MVPKTRTPEKPWLLSSLPRKVSSNTPIWLTRAVSLMKDTAKAMAGGMMTGQACGRTIWKVVWKRDRFIGLRRFDLRVGHGFEPAADDVGGIGDRVEADRDDRDGEERGVGRDRLDEEEDEVDHDEEGDAPEDLHIGDADDAEGQRPEAGRLAEVDEHEGEPEADDAAHERHAEREARGLQQEADVLGREEARELFEDALHQKMRAFTRKAQRPRSASPMLAMKVRITYITATTEKYSSQR